MKIFRSLAILVILILNVTEVDVMFQWVTDIPL